MPAGPTGGVTSYTYDAAGQQLTETDPDGQVSVFGYDQLGREISENDYSSQAEYDNDPGDPDETLTWTYNAAGQLAGESDQIFYGSGSSSTISYTYDAFGRTEIETQATSGAPTVEFDYTYDANGNVLTETDWAAGALVETTTYSGYNGLNLPAMVVVATTAATLTIDYQYSSVGQTEQMTRYQDGELVDTTTYTYDGDGNLSEEKVVGPSGSTLEDFQYVYNGEGEIVTAITPTQGYVEYTYDAAGQLTSATYPNTPWANESYTYDAAGNRTSTTTGSTTDDTQQTAASTTTTGNELTSDGTFVYEYDADGNLIYQARISQAYSADDQTFYSYNNQNELIDVCTEDNGDTITQEVTYSYNAAGQRVSESVTVGQNTTTTNFVYDLSGNAVLSFDGNQNLTGQYVYGQAVDQLLAQEDGSGNVSWMITDRDESVRDVLQSGGGTTSVIDHIDYNSFGETIDETAPSTPHLTGYAGYVNDLAIGMLETDSRVYDATIGRFISQDPSGFAGSANGNLYEYTSNSPLSNVDPSGLMQQSPLAQVLNSMPVAVTSTPTDFGGGDDSDGDGVDDDSGLLIPSSYFPVSTSASSSASAAPLGADDLAISDFDYSPSLASTDLPPAGVLPTTGVAVAPGYGSWITSAAQISSADNPDDSGYGYAITNPLYNPNFVGALPESLGPDLGEVAQSNAFYGGLLSTIGTGIGIGAVGALLGATAPAWAIPAGIGALFGIGAGFSYADRSADPNLSGWGVAGGVLSDVTGFTQASMAINGSDPVSYTLVNPVQQAAAQGGLFGGLTLLGGAAVVQGISATYSASAIAASDLSVAASIRGAIAENEALATTSLFADQGLTVQGASLAGSGAISSDIAGLLSSSVETAGMTGAAGFGSEVTAGLAGQGFGSQITAGLGGLTEFSPTLGWVNLSSADIASSLAPQTSVAQVLINRQAGISYQQQVVAALGAQPAGPMAGTTLSGAPYTTIPDGILPDGQTLEVKGGQTVSLGPQLQAQLSIGGAEGGPGNVLVVRPGAKVYQPVIKAFRHTSETPTIYTYDPATGELNPY